MNKVRPLYIYICLTLIVLAGVGLFAFKPFSAAAADTHDHSSGWEPWTNENQLPNEPGNYYLNVNVSYRDYSSWTVPNSGTTNLCLNGNKIEFENGSITINNGATLNIYDEGDGSVTSSSALSALINVQVGGILNIYGGTFKGSETAVNVKGKATIENATILGGNVSPGSGVNIENTGELTINGGSFKSINRRTISCYGKLDIHGGTFLHNDSPGDGDTYIGGEVTIEDADFSDCDVFIYGKATIKSGYFKYVFCAANANLDIQGGTYNNNGNQTIYVSGTVTIENENVTVSNSGSGAAVYINSGGTADISGGTFNGIYGVHNYGGVFKLSGSPGIKGSTADIYLSSNNKITVTGVLGRIYSLLTEDAPAVGNPVVFTDSENTDYNDIEKFTSIKNYLMRQKDGQLEFAVLDKYTVTYDKGTASDATGSPPSNTVTEGDSITLPGAVFTRTGYTQTGWSKNSDGSTDDYELSTKFTPDRSITLYPYWTANEYSITYKDQGGAAFSGSHESGYPTKHTYGTATSLKSATKTGYTFDGWYTESSCTNKVTSLSATGYTSNITLYAKWTAITYTITYNKGSNGTGTNTTDTKTYGVDFTLSGAKFTRTGYTQTGWSTTDGGAKAYDLGGTYTENKAITLYPVWTANQYTVNFDSKGGSSVTSKSVTYDSTYGDLPAPTKNGYTFVGWYTAETDGTKVESGTKITTVGDRTLYAYWTAIPYTITYNGVDGANNKGNPTTYTIESTDITLKAPEKTGYTFVGWTGNGNATAAKDVTIPSGSTGNRTYTANWTANTYNITYKDKGGADFTGTHESGYPVTHTYDTATPLKGAAKTGYTFDGWFKNSNCTGDPITSIGATDYTDNITLYAKWTAMTYTITYEKKGGEIENENEYVSYTYGVGLKLPNPTREGYTFGGWYEASDLSGESVTDISADEEGERTFYAKWTARSYIVTFDYNGMDSTGYETSRTVTFDSTYGTLPAPVRDGYAFVGWYTEATGGTPVTTSTQVKTAGDHTLYAHWSAGSFKVTFDCQGGNMDDPDMILPVTYGGTYGELPTPERTGYSFGGWFTEIESGTQIKTGDTVDITADITLYAHWTANTYTVTYYIDGTEYSVDTVYKTYTYDRSLTLPAPEKEGYGFDGWYTASNFTGSPVTSIEAEAYANDFSLYGKWTEGAYTVKFEYDGADGGNSVQSKTVIFDSEYGELPNPTKTGYLFGGWFISENEQVTESSIVRTANNHTLTAKWTLCVHSNNKWSDWTYDGTNHSHTCLDCKAIVTGIHEYGTWTDDNDGEHHTHECIVCGKSETAEHSWNDGETTTASTCTEKGSAKYTCTDCGAEKTEDVEALGHSFAGGEVGHNASGHWYICTRCNIAESEHSGHTWNEQGEILSAANCTEEGERLLTCTLCGETKTEDIPTNGDHNWIEIQHNEEEHTFMCTRCGISNNEYEEHTWTQTGETPPTCNADGEITYICAACGEQKTKTIDKDGISHKWSSEWQPDENKHWHICENGCGEIYSSADHMWNNGETTKEASCTEAGEKTFTCTICGYFYTEPIEPGHVFNEAWSYDSNEHYHVCTVCGERDEASVSGHDGTGTITTPATATETGTMTYTCDVCGYVWTEDIPAAGEDIPSTEEPSDGNGAGNITVDSESGENAPAVSIDTDTTSRLESEVYAEHTTPEERAAIDNGSNLDVILRVEDAGNTVPDDDKQATESVIAESNYTLGQYLNIDMLKFIDKQEVDKITRLSSPISVTIEVPENMRNANRTFVIVRIHDGIADTLRDIDNNPNTITIMTDRFSTYAIAYKDEPQGGRPGGQNGTGTPGNTGYPSSVTPDNIISDPNDKSEDSNSASEDVSSAAGLYGANELLGDTASIADMSIPAGIVLVAMAFIIRKRSKANK